MYEINIDWPRLAARMARNDDNDRALTDGFTRDEMKALDRMVARLDAETESHRSEMFQEEIELLGVAGVQEGMLTGLRAVSAKEEAGYKILAQDPEFAHRSRRIQ